MKHSVNRKEKEMKMYFDDIGELIDSEECVSVSEEELIKAVAEKKEYSDAEKYAGIMKAFIADAIDVDVKDGKKLVQNRAAIKKAILTYFPEESLNRLRELQKEEEHEA